MLEHSVTQEADAIEKYFCKPFGELPLFEMDTELASIFISFASSKDSDINVDKARKTIAVFSAIEKRLKASFTITLDNRTLLFLITVNDGVIGKCIIYLFYMQYIAKKKNIQNIDFLSFSTQFFPHGFPDDGGLKKVWEGQKIKRGTSFSDNLVDYSSASKSIQFL